MKALNILLLALSISWGVQAQEDSSAGAASDDLAVTDLTVDHDKPDNGRPGHLYHTVNAVDMPITLVLGGTSIYLMTVIYSKPNTPESTILSLNKNDVPSFDRWTAGWHDQNLDKISYIPFYGIMPLPLVLLADKANKGDRGRIGLMYLEAFAFEGISYTCAVRFADRFRPDVYNTDLSLSYRENGNFRNSFFAGHVAVMALSTFFVSKVYNDYHPHAKIRWLFYGSSAALTLGMAYLRLYAGKHFTSDIVVGATVGTAFGLGIPAIHKNRDYKKQKWSVAPDFFNGGGGISFLYRL